MSQNYKANPIIAPLISRPGESNEFVGTKGVVDLLPNIFDTPVNRRFLESTLEQLLSSGSLQAINHYLGNHASRSNNDLFLNDDRFADLYQFTPGIVQKDNNGNITSSISYDDIIKGLEYNEASVDQHNRLLNEPGYTLDLPINYDMFVNYHRYFWLMDFLPVCEIYATVADPITISDIIGSITYTTPTLDNDKTLEFMNGMRVSFKDNCTGDVTYDTDSIYIIEGVGQPTGIKLIKQYNNVGTRLILNNSIYSYTKNEDSVLPSVLKDQRTIVRDYVVEKRDSADQSAWARSNMWIRDDVANAICDYNDEDPFDYVVEAFRGIRPIIEYRASIEKYDYGKNHFGNITYIFDTIVNPATTIVGQTNWNFATYYITEEWNGVSGYLKDSKVKVTLDGVPTFWICIESHGTVKNPTYIENNKFWKPVYNKSLVNGETILFLGDANSTYKNKIYTVGGVGSSITLTELYNTTNYDNFDKILSKFVYTADLALKDNSEWYWDWGSTDWIYGQQKDVRSIAPKFNLYDYELNVLDDDTVYPNSNFKGDSIFDYTRTNSVVDHGLGFAPKYVDYGNNPGYEFDFGLGAVRYTYNKINDDINYQASRNVGNITDIKGYYYYKSLDTNFYYNGWVQLRGDQPIKKHITYVVDNIESDHIFNIGTTNINLNNKFRFGYSNNGNFNVYSENTLNARGKPELINGINPILFMSKGKTYTIHTMFDENEIEFVNVDGTAISTGLTFTSAGTNIQTMEIDSNIAIDYIRYRAVADASITGIIYLDDNTATNTIIVKINDVESDNYTLSGSFITVPNDYALDTKIEISWISLDNLTTDQGVFDVADTHVYNPQNEWLKSATFGDLQAHIKSQLTNHPGFVGDYYGANNYISIPQINEFGGTIRQQPFSTELLGSTLQNVDTNPFASLKYISSNYAKFRQQLLRKAIQLHNTQPIETSVYRLLDLALEELNVGKNKNSPFVNSTMLLYKDYKEVEYTWVSGESQVFDLPETVNIYDDYENHIQVFVYDTDTGGSTPVWRPIIKGLDYSLTNAKKVTITDTLSPDDDGRVKIKIRWFPVNSVSFVPPSSVKLGLTRSYTPAIINNYDVDGDGVSTGNVLLCHDGSIHVLSSSNLVDRSSNTFNITDAIIWEFETRIYNNLFGSNDSVVDYLESMPTAHRKTPYTWDDLNTTLEDEFNSWKVRNGVSTLNNASYYDVGNEFTWNYSSVSPYIGGWKGIYNFYFNTERPHTHPWEMLGYKQKPTWWDTYYTWLDTANGGNDAKRAALIEALLTGHWNSPAVADKKYNPSYCYSAYDWSTDTLVNADGTLNGPVTAGVVSTPTSIEKQRDFVFGDWGPIESQWRDSPEYRISRTLGLMRVRPLWVLNTFFNTNNRVYNYNTSIPTTQILSTATYLLGDNKNPKLSYELYEDNIIETISVKVGGVGYTSNTVIDIYGNFGSGATANAIVSGGSIIGVTLTNPGNNYQSKPSVIATDNTSVITTQAKFLPTLSSDVKKYYIGLSNAIVEFSIFNNSTITDVKTRFENTSYNPIVKTGGFINKNNQKFVLDSSQDKGKVVLPEQNYTATLYKSQPIVDTFYGAVKVTKVDTGYLVTGLDSSKQYFKYFDIAPNSKKIIVTTSTQNIIKYKEFIISELRFDYNTEVNSVQDVYNFIRGYGHYLNSQGWLPDWDISATEFLNWIDTDPAIGSYIDLIPESGTIQILEGDRGHYDTLYSKYDGVYNLIDKNGRQILPNKVLVERQAIEKDDAVTIIQARNTSTQIYGVRLFKVEIEHAIVFDIDTDFDDIIYKPALGQLHYRIKWVGNRTKNWKGKLYAPGYLVNNDTIINNLDRTVLDIDQVYDIGNNILNEHIKNAAKSNIGYQKLTWHDYTNLDDDTLFEFTKGINKYKGTKYALNAFLRNTSLFGSVVDMKLFEEWAIRTADYGDVRTRDTIEFKVNKELVKTSPQVVRFINTNDSDVLTDVYIDITPNSDLLVTGTVGNNFETRPAKVFEYDTISDEELYKNDFLTSGTPLTTEVDYRMIDFNAFKLFPEQENDYYDFSGDWQDLKAWDSKKSYKYGDRVIYQGSVWQMVDTTSATGLERDNDPIVVTGTITLPIVDNNRTLILDGNTITFDNTTTSTTRTIITVTGTNDIGTTNVVAHGSTLILGTTSDNAQTVTFSNTVSTTTFNDIVLTASVNNPTFTGSSTATLIIDGTTINFNDTTTVSTNINAQAAFEDAFTSWVANNNASARSAAAIARITAIENLRSAYTGSWSTFLSTYFSSSDAGLNISALLTEIAATPSYQAEVEALLDSDITLINNYANTSYVTANVIAGSETVTAGDISTAQGLMEAGTYISDVKDWLISNTTTTFTVLTIIATTSGTVFVTYDIGSIVSKINAAGITNVTASISASKLRLTKTTATPATQFTMVIGAGTLNSSVGLTADTYTSTGSTVITTPNLSISQVINQINAANITGIVAGSIAPAGVILKIESSNSSLYVGAGTANSVIGITSGVTAAATTTIVTNISSYINDIVAQINNASISGVRASNSNNRLKLTSTNSTFIIGAGTANSDVGITAQTLAATQTTISNVFEAIVSGTEVFRKMDYDPHIFSMWVARWQNDNTQSEDAGFAVYQTMDMGWYITRACAGINAADDAQISIATPTGSSPAHSLQAGDYVLIRGSNTQPSIDGIHLVTDVDTNNNNKFYIDLYIDKEGNIGNVYPIKNVRFSTYSQLVNNYDNTINGTYIYNFAGYRQNTTTRPIYAYVDKISDQNPRSGVYRYYGNFSPINGYTGDDRWELVREGNDQARNDLIGNVKVYNALDKTVITTIEVFDPAKGILPGFIDSEIDFKTTTDFAVYNNDSVNGYNENRRSWGEDQVGLRWWDLSTAIYLDYEQGPIDYQQNNWGRLFDGSSVDIYEWTESNVLPEQWEQLVNSNSTVNGIPVTGEVLKININNEDVYYWSEKSIFDPVQNRTKTVYYFWVKNKVGISGTNQYSSIQLSNYLKSPNSFEQLWVAASGSDNLIINNLENVVNEHTVLQVNKILESGGLPLSEWTLVHDSDSVILIPEQLHIKMRDSIVGYNNAVRRYSYSTYDSGVTYSKNNVVIDDNDNFYISLVNSNLNHEPVNDTTMSYWARVYKYELPDETETKDIDIWRGQPLPDLNLHEYNRYGHLTRPNQSLVRNLKNARQNFVYAANDLLSRICIVNEVFIWESLFDQTITDGVIEYDLEKYWIYVDWYRKTYNSDGSLLSVFDKTILPDIYVDSKFDLIPEMGDAPLSTEEGTLVYVRTSLHKDGINRPEIYMLENGEWVLQWKHKGTLQLSEELWNLEKFGYGFDVGPFDMDGFDAEPSNIILAIFDILRNSIFVNQYKEYYNKLWFKCLYHSITENTTDDFAFKTTYTKIRIEHPVLTDATTYQKFETQVVEEFYNNIKPYHTKLHSIDRAVTHFDENDIEVTELELDKEITIVYNDHSIKDSDSFDIILTGGTFTSTTLNEDYTEFTTVDGDIEYLYNGNEFIQVAEDSWGEELYPIDYSENIRIRVQTNASGDTVDSDTRSFEMNYYLPYQIEESTVIVDSNKTTLAQSINATTTTIEVADGSLLAAPVDGKVGVVRIGNERIEYGAIDGNVLRYCTRGTLGTSATTHSSGDTVIDASWIYKIPTLDSFKDYGDNLRMAYNDTGVSLSAAGSITPEHIFIRNAGSGSI